VLILLTRDIKANDNVLIVDDSCSFAIGTKTVRMYGCGSLLQLEWGEGAWHA
jgi:hypothetical protein